MARDPGHFCWRFAVASVKLDHVNAGRFVIQLRHCSAPARQQFMDSRHGTRNQIEAAAHGV